MSGPTLAWSLTLLVLGSQIPSHGGLDHPDRCVTLGEEGVPYDCEEERNVTMRILLSHEGNFEECSGDCEQLFVVWCEDYWSGGHQTRHAILHYEASGSDSLIALDQVEQAHGGVKFRVQRELNCDLDPLDLGNSLDCDDLDCSPGCCREISHFITVGSRKEVLVDEIENLGTLPCFVLQRNPFMDGEAQHGETPPNIGVHPPGGGQSR